MRISTITIRHDPPPAVSCRESDPLGLNQRACRDRGRALAGKSTLNRMELAVKGPDARHKRIVADAPGIESTLPDWAVAAPPRARGMILLDFDAIDDPIHGAQRGCLYHGHHRHYCYPPLHRLRGDMPPRARSRTSRRDAGDGAVASLGADRGGHPQAFGGGKEDPGARGRIMAWCEARKNRCHRPGPARDPRPQEELEDAFGELESEVDPGRLERAPRRRFTDLTHGTLTSWSRGRRVVGEAEPTVGGRNPRFVVTNPKAGTFDARRLHEDIHRARGEMENRIKGQRMDPLADRASTGILDANRPGLWFSAFAHSLVEAPRGEMSAKTSLASATIGRIRPRFLKPAARVKISYRRILVEWCSACPNQPDHLPAHAALSG